jgi:hypothetical protein
MRALVGFAKIGFQKTFWIYSHLGEELDATPNRGLG